MNKLKLLIDEKEKRQMHIAKKHDSGRRRVLAILHPGQIVLQVLMSSI